MKQPKQIDCLPWIRHIGTKIVDLVPTSATDAEALLDRPLCKDNADSIGSGYLVRYPDGYVSWSPAKAVEEAYISCSDLSIGLAIEAIKKGHKVSCYRWDDVRCYIYYVRGTKVPAWRLRNEAEQLNTSTEEFINIDGHFDIYTPNGIIVGWTPSSTDLVLDDFYIVDEDQQL